MHLFSEKIWKLWKNANFSIFLTFPPSRCSGMFNVILLTHTDCTPYKFIYISRLSVNIRSQRCKVPDLWDHKVGWNCIFLKNTEYSKTLMSILGVKDCKKPKDQTYFSLICFFGPPPLVEGSYKFRSMHPCVCTFLWNHSLVFSDILHEVRGP